MENFIVPLEISSKPTEWKRDLLPVSSSQVAERTKRKAKKDIIRITHEAQSRHRLLFAIMEKKQNKKHTWFVYKLHK